MHPAEAEAVRGANQTSFWNIDPFATTTPPSGAGSSISSCCSLHGEYTLGGDFENASLSARKKRTLGPEKPLNPRVRYFGPF
jgi:hypothetical protein